MNRTGEQFFELLKGGIWNVDIKQSLFERHVDWPHIMQLAEMQSVIGVVFDGIQKLPKPLLPGMDLLMNWLGQSSHLEEKNKDHNKELHQLVDYLNSVGIASRLLKGQGCGTYYPNALHRQCGDIDLFVGMEQYERAKDALKAKGCIIERESKKDAHFGWNGIPVELHRLEALMYNPLLNDTFQKICRKEEWCSNSYVTIDGNKLAVMNPTFNVFLVFVHIWHHFVLVGVGLRQVCDWILMMNAEEQNINWDKLYYFLKRMGILRAWRTFYRLSVITIGLKLQNTPGWMEGACDYDVKLVLNDIMTVGNLGKHSETMRKRSIGKGITGNVGSYFALLKRLCKIFRFGRCEVIGYIVYKSIHGVNS